MEGSWKVFRLPGQDRAEPTAQKPRIGSSFDRGTRINSPVVERVEWSLFFRYKGTKNIRRGGNGDTVWQFNDLRAITIIVMTIGYGVALPRQLHLPRMARITKQRPVPVG